MILLDYRDKRPIYEQVVEKLEHLIICGGLAPGSRLPSVRSLAMDLSVNPNTIQRAYALLEQEGYIYTVIGRGNYVTEKDEWQAGHFKSLKQDFTTLLTQAHEVGMPRKELLKLVDSVYGKEDLT